MDTLITILLGVIVSLLAREIWANAPRLGHWLIKRAVLRLPPSKRDQYDEEWRSHLEQCPGAIGKLHHALGCYFRAAGQLAAEKQLTPETEKKIIKLTIKIIVRFQTLPLALPLILRGKFNNVRAMWKMTEILMVGIYMVRTKFGGTDADVKALNERFENKLRNNAEKPGFENALAALDNFSKGVREIGTRRSLHAVAHGQKTTAT